MSTIRLQSSDGEIFEVEEKVAKTSGTIKTMLEDCGIQGDSDTVVPLPNVRGAILRKVLEYANHHKDDPVPIDDNILLWDANFLNVDRGTLFDLMMAANYLDTKGLYKMCSIAIAKMIKGKSPEELRKTFNIVNDLSDDEQ